MRPSGSTAVTVWPSARQAQRLGALPGADVEHAERATGRCAASWRVTISWRTTLRRLPSRSSQGSWPATKVLSAIANVPRHLTADGIRARPAVGRVEDVTDDALTPDQIQRIRDRVAELMPQVRADLEALVRIPSVSACSFDQSQVARSAEAVAELLRARGSRRRDRRRGRPAGRHRPPRRTRGRADGDALRAPRRAAPRRRGRLGQPPFEPDRARRPPLRSRRRRRQGRRHGARRGAPGARRQPAGRRHDLRRGRGGVRLAVVRRRSSRTTATGSPPTPSSSPTPATGTSATPALTTTLRGGVRVVVRVRTLDHSVHSGMFGGAAPDAITALVRLLATLHDDDGNVAVAGLDAGEAADLDYDEARFREESGLLDGVSLIGSGSILSRLWTKPSITTIGIDATSVDKASNTLAARPPPSPVRLAPTQDPLVAFERVRAHLEGHAPWGAQVEVDARGARPGLRRRRRRAGLRRGARVLRRRVGHRAGRHRRRRLDPVHRRLRRALPGRRDHRHRRRGPRHAGARRQRVAAPRRVREGLRGRGGLPRPAGRAAARLTPRRRRRAARLVRRRLPAPR